ncbi:MAG: DUF1836 domain-containing protein [Atopobiaceae bacterium]|nr:DUF1836 domain-containing protein [Atopobiaceae bacterium]
MPNRKKAEIIEPFDYDCANAELCNTMKSLHISRIGEMPKIELYLDQILSIVTDELSPLYDDGEKIITGAMVNNYVKQKVLPAPRRKRYTRRHLASLLFVCVLKRVLSIAQVGQLIRMCEQEQIDLMDAYDHLVEAFEQALALRFTDGENYREPIASIQLVTNDGRPVPGTLSSLVGSAVGLVVNKVYVEKLLALEERRVETEPALEQ